ncbi:MAG: CobW family GTP-binding protein [Bacillota bacterium]
MIIDIISGFLGSGKTTFIRQLTGQLTPLERVVVLVNEFGQVGVDGALLRQGGNEVVELSSGCICCTMKADLGRQIPEIAVNFAPDRLIIEPSGVATIRNVLESVGSLRLEPYVQAVRVIGIVDGQAFPGLLAASPLYVRSQLVYADLILINKCDLITAVEAGQVRETIAAINGRAAVLLTSYGRVTLDQLDASTVHAGVMRGGGESPLRPASLPDTPHYQSFSRQMAGAFDRQALRQFFTALGRPEVGEVVRAKGIFQCTGGWVRYDFLPQNFNEADLTGRFDGSRLVVIGHHLDTERLAGELLRCLLPPGDGG